MSNEEYFKKTKEQAAQKPIDTKKHKERYLEAIRSFEQNEIDTIKAKAKVFIRLSIGEFFVIILLAAALICLAPLKTAVPFLVRVDNLTGYTDIVQPLSDAKESYSEAETSHLLWQYVINYESYDWQTIQEMNNIVEIMSDNKTFSEYDTAVRADNSPLHILRDNFKMKVKVKSTTFLKPDVAQVRFTKMILDSSGKPAAGYQETNWIATIAFDFNKDIKTEEDKNINPLRFQALSYRVDPEAAK